MKKYRNFSAFNTIIENNFFELIEAEHDMEYNSPSYNLLNKIKHYVLDSFLLDKQEITLLDRLNQNL